MSLFLSHPTKLPMLVRSSPLLYDGFSSNFLPQTPPCSIEFAEPFGRKFGRLVIMTSQRTYLEKKVPRELMKKMGTIGSSNGWVATWKDDGILRLQDDLNPNASDSDPKRIPLPPLVTLPHCQTKIVTSLAMSSSSPEDEDCVVAVKFLGPQLSFCRPSQRDSVWINVRIQNQCFFSNPVMFSKMDQRFSIAGSGGHLIGSWDLRKHMHIPKFQKLSFRNLPKLSKTKQELMYSCCTSEHVVESRPTGETFLVKLYRKGVSKMKTKALMVFKLDEEGNAVYTKDIGDLCIYISNAEPFCVRAGSFPDILSNHVIIYDFDELAFVNLHNSSIIGRNHTFCPPYHIPPQTIT